MYETCQRPKRSTISGLVNLAVGRGRYISHRKSRKATNHAEYDCVCGQYFRSTFGKWYSKFAMTTAQRQTDSRRSLKLVFCHWFRQCIYVLCPSNPQFCGLEMERDEANEPNRDL